MNKNFTPVEWSHYTNIYEVNVRQYTQEGTFNAFAKELPRLKDMGVHTLWFMPVTPIAQKRKKGTLGSYYACSDYTDINPEFGNLSDFKNLVNHAHAMKFKVIIDWVANHTGWDHIWTKEHPAYYKMDEGTHDFKMASGMEDIIELDFENPNLRRAMIDAMRFWVNECDIDGFRCDLAYWVELSFWIEARAELEKIKKLFWLGELDPLVKSEYMGVFDAAYTWTWMHKTKDFYENKISLLALEEILKRYDSTGDSTMRTWFTTNHDENSWNGTEYEKYGLMAKALAVFSATWNGIPLLYSGQELPLLNRLKFFDKDIIPWRSNYQLHDFYKTLLNIHSNNPALRAGDTTVRTFRLKTNNDEQVFAYLRRNGDHEVLVVLNLSREDQLNLKIEDKIMSGTYTDVFSKKDFDSEGSFQLKAWDYLVCQK